MALGVNRLPNGKFGIFSSVVDDYIYLGTLAEVREFLADRQYPFQGIERLILRATEDQSISPEPKGDGLDRFRESMFDMALNKTPQQLNDSSQFLELSSEHEATFRQHWRAIREEHA